jgi:molybdenum cofactor sulfurtransferase
VTQVTDNGPAARERAAMTTAGVRLTVPGGVPAVAPASTGEAAPDWDGGAVQALRDREYARLDENDQVYLDYTGGGLYAQSQLDEHHALLRGSVLGNPHSDSPASAVSTRFADEARAAILSFLNASPDEYDVVFTANATAALRLVGEAYPFEPGGRFALTADNHNSVNGIRELARASGADVEYVPLAVPDLRVADAAVLAALDRAPRRPGLFAYPAQSNYSGVRHPLGWIEAARQRGWDVLLDASAFVPTTPLDLGRWRPDFVAISWYKVFGYPTGIGSLVARHAALRRLRRPWFAGGSIGVASVAEPRNTWAPGHVGFEDGTLDYLGLPGIGIGLRHVDGIGIPVIGRRVQWLTRRLLGRMARMRHRDGSPLLRLYGPLDDVERGGTIPFNLLEPDGSVVDFGLVEAAAAAQRISLRTGCFCNPGASEAARGITGEDMARVFALGHPPAMAELRAIMPGKALGAVRASVGIATTEGDVDRFLAFLEGFADDRRVGPATGQPAVTRIVLPSGSSTSAIQAPKSVRKGDRRLR